MIEVVVGAIAVGAFVKGVTGFGLPQIAIPVMAVFLGVEHAVVIMAIPGVVSNGWLVWSHREMRRHTRDLPGMLGVGTVGAVVGTVLLKTLDGRVLSLILASLILAYVLLTVFRSDVSLVPRITRFTSPPVGFLAGGLQGATGISGPLLTTYLHAMRLPVRAYVLSLSVLFLVFSLVQTATLVALGAFTDVLLAESLLALIPIMLLLPLGSRLRRHLSPTAFRWIVLILLTVTAIQLIHDALTGAS